MSSHHIVRVSAVYFLTARRFPLPPQRALALTSCACVWSSSRSCGSPSTAAALRWLGATAPLPKHPRASQSRPTAFLPAALLALAALARPAFAQSPPPPLAPSPSTCGTPQTLYSVPPGLLGVTFFSSTAAGGLAATVRWNPSLLIPPPFSRSGPASSGPVIASDRGETLNESLPRRHSIPQSAVPFEIENLSDTETMVVQSTSFQVVPAPNPPSGSQYALPGLFSLM